MVVGQFESTGSGVESARQCVHYWYMPKRSSKADFAQNALRVVEGAVGEPLKPPEKNPAAVALGKLGGLKGGAARAASMSSERRSEIAKAAAMKRWKGQRQDDKR